MKIVICDDDSFTRNLYYELIRGIADAEDIAVTVRCVSSGEELLELLEKDNHCVNLIYLDIYMDGKDGFTVAKESRRLGYEGEIVICSSDENRALEAFEVKARNYIVKGATDYNWFREIFLSVAENIRGDDDYEVVLTKNRKKISIPVKQINYFEIYNRKVITHYNSNDTLQTLETYGNLKQLEEELAGKDFVRIHNAYLVNGRQIRFVFSDYVQLNSGERLTVSRNCKKKLMEYWTSNRP